MDKINKLREEIDLIDTQIMELLDSRFFVTKAIGQEKKTNSKVVLDQNREKIILDKTANYSHYPEIKSIYEYIMSVSRSQQRK